MHEMVKTKSRNPLVLQIAHAAGEWLEEEYAAKDFFVMSVDMVDWAAKEVLKERGKQLEAEWKATPLTVRLLNPRTTLAIHQFREITKGL